jgi:hypothetical protein
MCHLAVLYSIHNEYFAGLIAQQEPVTGQMPLPFKMIIQNIKSSAFMPFSYACLQRRDLICTHVHLPSDSKARHMLSERHHK